MKIKNILKESRGITLIALVVTIVVLLILAGITISLVFSENGIIAKAREAEEKTNQAIINEQEQMNELAEYMGNMLNGIGGGSKPGETLPSDGTYSETKRINTPDTSNGQLTPIKWDIKANDWVETTGDDPDWYDYSAKEWANAKTSDGSMWVWIPRFAYKITNGYHASTEGTIEIEFLKGKSNETVTGQTIVEYNESTTSSYTQFPNGYVIHPAFNYGKPVSGLWVAKFEASQSNASASSSGSSETIKIQPGVQSWRNISVNDIYTRCLQYNSTLNSHMMKNDEWGAVAYLSKSNYGKGTEEIWINNSSSYITGSAGNDTSAETDTGTTNDYTNTQGVEASTTGNVYGIYDMSGGAWEYVAGYVNNGNSSLTTYASSLVNGDAKTKNVYVQANTDNNINNYNANLGVYGDAIYEISASGSDTTSWYNDYSGYPFTNYPFFGRGGYCYNGLNAGIFAFYSSAGNADNGLSFRPVLIVL